MNFMGFKLAGSKYCLTIKVALRKPVTISMVVCLYFGQQTSPYMVFAKWGFPIACFRRLVKKETLISYHAFNSPFFQPTSQTLWSLQAMPLDNFRFITIWQKLLCFIGKTWTKAHIGLTFFVQLLYIFCSLVFQLSFCIGWTLVQV